MIRLVLFIAFASHASMAHAIKIICAPQEVKDVIAVKARSSDPRKVFYVLFPKEYRGEKFLEASITISGKNGSLVSAPLAAEPSSSEDWADKLVAFIQTVHSTSRLSVEARYGCASRLTADISP